MNNLINSKEKHFYYQESARSGKLTMEEYAIYCFILQYVDEAKGVAYPSVETIYTKLNTTKKRVMKNLKSLKEKGFIDWESGNSQKANTYYFTHYSQLNNSIGTNLTPITGTNLVPITGTNLVPPKENIKENIKENNNNVSNETKTKKLFGGLFSNNEEKEKECHSFTNVQELGGLTTNDDSIESTIQNNKSIFNCDEDEPIFNYNTNEYENITDDNEELYLSLTELMDMNGIDEDSIQNNPYVKQWIVDEMLSIINYTTANKKVKDNILYWLEENKHLIYYFRRELNENSSKYDWMVDRIDNKTQRLNTIKSMLLKECQSWYKRNHESSFEIIDDVDLPSWCLY